MTSSLRSISPANPGSFTSEPSPSEIAEATSADLLWTLSWTAQPDGVLAGDLIARNVSDRRVRLSGKPGLQPLAPDAAPLDVETMVSLEFLLPGFVELAPGDLASAEVGWAGWDGPDPSGEVLIQWPGGEAPVQAVGTNRPPADGPATNLWPTWFRKL